jgi:hypothetical protein
MFDHPDDDVYDGILLENDEEVPRVQLEFIVEEVVEATNKRDRNSEVANKNNKDKDKSPVNPRRDSSKTTPNNMT